MHWANAHTWSLRAVGLVAALGACNQVLGIEPASIDPRLSVAGLSGSSHAGAGVGGSSAPASSGAGGTGAAGGTGLTSSSGGTDPGGHSHGASGGTAPANGGEAGDGMTGPSSGGSTSGTHGGSGHGGTAPASEAGAGGDASGPKDTCDQYCDIMDSECTGNDAQYRDREQCLKICHLLPEGTEGGSDDDSIACRLKYAQKGHYANGSELSVYCHQSGPSGDGRCGSVCEAYCALMAEVCTAETADTYHFASNTDCMNTCNGLPKSPVPYSSSDPQVSDGNHAMCRIFHVTSAAMADADEHCEHAMGITLCEATGQ